MGPFAQRDAMAHLSDPPRALGHVVQVVRAEWLDSVGRREEVERFTPRVPRHCLASAIKANGTLLISRIEPGYSG